MVLDASGCDMLVGDEIEKKHVDDAGFHAECVAEIRLRTLRYRSQGQQFRAEVEVAAALRRVSYKRTGIQSDAARGEPSKIT